MATDLLSETTALNLRLVFDTAALVLIWLVQLVIYPVFIELERTPFRRWHPVYTRRVSYAVMPIMLGQAGLYAWLTVTGASWWMISNALLVGLMWAITFFRAVPLHAALDGEEEHLPLAQELLRVNWWRTAGWSLVWGLTMIDCVAV